MTNSDTYTLEQVREILLAARAAADGATIYAPVTPAPLAYSFEMKQASKGQRYYDIKVYNIQPDDMDNALTLYDRLDEELQKRALLGE